jgi:trimeric autotransporter adhesin
VSLTANVINPQATYSPKSVSFGTDSVGTTTQSSVTLTNTGATPLTISSISIKGTNPGDFSVSSCPATLAANASCTFSVNFKPTAKGARSAYVYVVDNTQSGSQQVALSGTGK